MKVRIKNSNDMSNILLLLNLQTAQLFSTSTCIKIHVSLVIKSINSQDRYLKEIKNSNKFHIIGKNFNKILSDYSIKNICILKIDIEGAERKLFNKSCNKIIVSIIRSCMFIFIN